MRKFIPLTLIFSVILAVSFLSNAAFSQSKAIKFKQVKELATAYEYEIAWEGADYKTTYYEVKGILENEPAVVKQVFLWKLRLISAVISKDKNSSDLRALFISHGFKVIDLSPEAIPHTSDK